MASSPRTGDTDRASGSSVRRRGDSDRASAVTVGIVFVGLAIVTALLAGSFWILATGNGDGGDPTALSVDSTLCSVASDDHGSGIGSVTLSVRYRGNGTVDLSNAVVAYGDERTTATLDVGASADASTVRLENASGAFAPEIGAGGDRTLRVDLAAVRGDPLPSGVRGTLDLKVQGATVASTSVRAPSGVGENDSFVAC